MNNMKVANLNRLGYRVSLSIEDVIDNWDEFFAERVGLAAASTDYMILLKDELIKLEKEIVGMDIKTLSHKLKETIFRCIYGNQDTNEGKLIQNKDIAKNVTGAIARALLRFYAEGLIDPRFSSRWKLVDQQKKTIEIGNPVMIGVQAGLIPIMDNSSAQSRKFFRDNVIFYLRPIFNRQREDEIFKRSMLYFFLDEAARVLSRLAQDITSQFFVEIASEGRPNYTGLVWATNRPNSVPKELFQNSNIRILFRTDEALAKQALKQFGIDQYIPTDKIVHLPKHHCLVHTKEGGEIVLVGPDGQIEELEAGEYVMGKSLPTLSEHMAPNREAMA